MPIEKSQRPQVDHAIYHSGLKVGNQRSANCLPIKGTVEHNPDPLSSFLNSKGNLLSKFQPVMHNLKIPLFFIPIFKVFTYIASIIMSVLTEESGNLLVQKFEREKPSSFYTAANETPNGTGLLKLLISNHHEVSNLKGQHCIASFVLQRINTIQLQRMQLLDIARSNKSIAGSQLVVILNN